MQIEAKRLWNLNKDYFEALMQANKNEQLFTYKLKKLTIKRDKLKSDVDGLHLVVKHHCEKKKEWTKSCEDMKDFFQSYVVSLETQIHEVNKEINLNHEIKLPWKVFKLEKYCQNLSRSLM